MSTNKDGELKNQGGEGLQFHQDKKDLIIRTKGWFVPSIHRKYLE